MKLLDLDPKWLIKDGQRVGFVFRNPVRGQRGWWTSCFFKPTPSDDQDELIEALLGEDACYQGCKPEVGWSVVGGAEAAKFENISVTPSLDGGPNFWHGFITNGQIDGGI